MMVKTWKKMLLGGPILVGSLLIPSNHLWAQSNNGWDSAPDIQEQNVGEITSYILYLGNSGQWPLLIGFLVMMAVYFANRLGLKERVGSALVPWIALLTSVATNLGGLLLVGRPWTEAVLTGVLSGIFSVGFWELVGKRLLPT